MWRKYQTLSFNILWTRKDRNVSLRTSLKNNDPIDSRHIHFNIFGWMNLCRYASHCWLNILSNKYFIHRDLSSTAITSLPIKGLEKLEILKIEHTFTLKYIPSIYDLHVSIYFYNCCHFMMSNFTQLFNIIQKIRSFLILRTTRFLSHPGIEVK